MALSEEPVFEFVNQGIYLVFTCPNMDWPCWPFDKKLANGLLCAFIQVLEGHCNPIVNDFHGNAPNPSVTLVLLAQ